MLLTLKQPGHHGFNKSFHDYSPPTPPSTSRFSPALTAAGPSYPFCSAALPSRSHFQQPKSMSTPHRGLPPPAAMGLPQPSHGPPALGQAPTLSQSLGQFPAPPSQWQGAEESMRNWLQAKSEEDRRKQEEEKTRQESLRLEQRKIEQEMLHTSLSGGIPPYMIPMVFAGMGGGNLPNASLEWAQHYMAQAHHLQQQSQQQSQLQHHPQQGPPSHGSPELRRESRQIAHPSHHPVISAGALGGPPQLSSGYYAISPSSRSRQPLPVPSSLSRITQSGGLPRLNTGEMHIQPPPSGPLGIQSLPSQPSHPLQQTQTVASQEAQPSPSIYFHHWQPPSTQSERGGGNQPTTPSDAPNSPPKKRKAQGPQQPAPPPSNTPQYTSPPFSQGGSSMTGTPARRRHSRNQSDVSSRGMDPYNRPRSRQRPTGSSFGSQPGASPVHHQPYDPIGSATSENQTAAYGPDRYEPRQQQFSTVPELRRSPRDREAKSPEREPREARDREPLPSTSRGPGFKRDDA